MLCLQVSTMAFYENIAAGVVYLVPSPRVMASWAHGQPQEETGGRTFAFPADSQCPRRGGGGAAAYRPPVCRDWPHADDPDFPWDLVDWYHSDFRDVVITWDSWADLKAKLQTTDFDAVRGRAVALMDERRERVVEQWRDVLGLGHV